MSSRETVIEFVSKLPEEMSVAEIAREIELLAGLQTAREQARRGEGISPEGAPKLVEEPRQFSHEQMAAWVSEDEADMRRFRRGQ